jgi:hypothetical protein
VIAGPPESGGHLLVGRPFLFRIRNAPEDEGSLHMSDRKRLTAKAEGGQNQVGVINRELRPMIIRVTDEDGEPVPFTRVDIHRMDEGQGYFEMVDQETDQAGNAAALYVPSELTTRYEIEFRVINGDDSSAAVLFSGCVTDPMLGDAVELPVTVGLKRTGRTIHPRADVPEMNATLASPRIASIPAPKQEAALNDRWFSEPPAASNDHTVAAASERLEPPVIPPPPLVAPLAIPLPVSAVLAAPVVPSNIPRTPPRPRPVPMAVTTAKKAVAHRHFRPRRREIPLKYLIAAAVMVWVFVSAGFLAAMVTKPVSIKSGQTTDMPQVTDPSLALHDTGNDGR